MQISNEISNEFLGLRKIADLANILEVDALSLKLTALNPEYKSYLIPKKNRGFREIDAPDSKLKGIQRSLNYLLQSVYLLIRPQCVHGFIITHYHETEKIGIVSNAKVHILMNKIMTLDIEDFFHCFSAKNVKNLFLNEPFGLSPAISNILSMLTTYRGRLPVGSPTSPVISNFLSYHLDLKLTAFASAHNILYSRYADDITLSSNDFISNLIIQNIKLIISEEGFKINNKKFRIQSSNRRQLVTGLVVNKKVNINRRYIRRIRAILFDWHVNGVVRATARYFKMYDYPNPQAQYQFQKSLKGRIDFIGFVRGKEDRIYKNFHQQFKAIQNFQD